MAAFDKAPGVILGSVGAENGDIVMRNLDWLVEGKIPWGKPDVVGAEQGFISVPTKAPAWVNGVPEDVRNKFEEEMNKVITGERSLPVPQAVLDKIDAAAQKAGG